MRTLSTLAAVVTLAAGCLSPWSTAAAAASPQFPYKARVTAEDVYVRSGPGQNYYPTDKLAEGDTVEVYRHDPGGWYAVRPPDGSFAWVSARYLSPGEANLAVVNAENVAARLGSRFSDIRDVIQVRLKKGEVVEVLGAETDREGIKRWYKIAPPSGEFRWISGRYLEPVDVGDDRLAAKSAEDAAASEEVTSSVGDASGASGVADVAQALLEGVDHLDGAPVAAVVPDVAAVARAARPRELNAEEYEAALERLDLELSGMVAEEPSVWAFDRLQREAAELAAQAQTAVERGRSRVLVEKIERFVQLGRRYKRLAALKQGVDQWRNDWSAGDVGPLPESPSLGQTRPISSAKASPYPSATTGRFDGIGKLTQVATTKVGAPRFVLLDDQGKPNCYITPAPGVNLRYYLGHRVGVNGTAGYIPEQRARHVTASHIQPLDTRLR